MSLTSRDTTPSILHMPLEPRNGTLIEPATKRQKTDDSERTVTIASKISSGAYTTLEGIAADVEKAASNVLELLAQYALRPDQAGAHSLLASSATHRQAAVANVLSFKKIFADVILREKAQNRSLSTMEQRNGGGSNLDKLVTERLMEENQRALLSQQNASSNASATRCVLTLYGSAPQPKQLFSSLQTPVRITPKPSIPSRLALEISRESHASTSTSQSSLEVLTPIRESSLPSGISTTMLIPTHFPELKEEYKNQVPTLGEVFPPPSTLPQLQPPKPSKYTTTRGNVVTFYNPADHVMDTRSSHRSWTTQPLSTGEWLNYGGMPSIQQPSSPEAKRRKRERALSSGEQEAEIPVPPEWIEIQNKAKEEARAEALFRRNYSSFAPTYDDTGAVVPAAVRAQLWWHRVGRERYEQSLALDEPTDQNTGDQRPEVEVSATATQVDDDEEARFREAVENWIPENPPANFFGDEAKPGENKSIDETLRDTSQLLETLNSYQQVRNLSLTSGSSHSTIPIDPSLSRMIGTPSSPSAAETELSDRIRKRLAAQIERLPPYEVARLNGDQLAELNVSTKLVSAGKDYKGVMEEEEIISRPIAGVVSTGVSPGSSVRAGTTGVPYGAPQPGAYPSRPMYGTQPTGSPRPTAQMRGQGGGQYYPQQTSPGGGRGSTLNTPRITSGSMGPPQGGASAQNTQRVSYGGQTNPQQYFQNQSSVGYNQQYPPPGTTTPYQRPSQPQYQQHAQQRQQNQIVYGGGSAARNATSAYAARMAAAKSSQPAPTSYGPSALSTPTPTQNHPYASATTTTPTSRAYLQALSSSSQATAMQQASSNLGASGFHTWMSPQDQANMMERQRAQLAAQQQQMQIHNTAAAANPRAMQANILTSVSSSAAAPPTGAGTAGNTQAQSGTVGNAAVAQMIAQPVRGQTPTQSQNSTQQVNDTGVAGEEVAAGAGGSLSGENTITEQITRDQVTEQQTAGQDQGRGQGQNDPVPVTMTMGATTIEAETGMGGNNPSSNPVPATAVGGGDDGN